MRSKFLFLGVLSVAVFSLSMFTAEFASAEFLFDGGKAGLFRVLGSSALVTGEIAIGEQTGFERILIPGRNLDLRCFEVIEHIKFISDTEGLASFEFIGCVALEHNKETLISGCSIKSIFTGSALLLAKKHEGKSFLLYEPDSPNTNITTVEFESGKGCALPLKNSISGSYVAELQAGENTVQSAVSSEAFKFLFGDKLLFGTFEASIDGEARIELIGSHHGCTFGIV